LIDLFSLALTHGLMAIAALRLLQRADLDLPGRMRGKRRRRTGKSEGGDGHA
jgi:hypothetical protein